MQTQEAQGYRDRLASAIIQAIAEQSCAGDVTAISAREAGQALMLVLGR
jgi:hypothetical protein